jgi:KDO2-lipid IV(A) lauroyltransferase
MKESVAVELFSGMERLAMSLPERWGHRLFDAGGSLAYRLAPKARATVAANLSRVLGKPPGSNLVQKATREAFRSYARYWHDTFSVRSLPREEFLKRFDFRGRAHLDHAVEAGTGAILGLPHLGNWDAAGRWVAESGYAITAVAEELKPARMYRLFERHRRALGMGVVPLSESKKVGPQLAALLAQNHLLALVCDRDLKGTGVEVEMFGATLRMPAGPALLSLATGSPLLPCSCFDTEDGWGCLIRPPLEIERTGNMRHDVTALTRKLAAEFERDISAHPTQWHMFQPAWDGG